MMGAYLITFSKADRARELSFARVMARDNAMVQSGAWLDIIEGYEATVVELEQTKAEMETVWTVVRQVIMVLMKHPRLEGVGPALDAMSTELREAMEEESNEPDQSGP